MKNTEPVFEVPFKGDVFHQALQYFVQHRKEMRKPIKPTAAKLISRLLAKYTEAEATEMLETSIRNGWQGVFAPPVTARKPWDSEKPVGKQSDGTVVGPGGISYRPVKL